MVRWSSRQIADQSRARASFWRIVQEYALLSSDPDQTLSDPFIDLGALRIEWPLSMPLAEVYSRGVEALTRLYRLNYMLYHSEYVARKSSERRNSR